MGKDLYDLYPEIKEIYSKADEILGFKLTSVSFEGPEDKLKQTFITQPAIFTQSVALTEVIRKKLNPEFSAGHSLGEYSALVCAGALSFEEGLKLVKLRGELMQKAGEEQKGTMAAVMGLNPQNLEEICKEASSAGIVQVANFNSPGQIVISGSVEGVRKAMELAKEAKAKLVKELIVHGAFHSPLMEPAKEEFKNALDTAPIGKVKFPVYANVNARPVTPDTPVEYIKELLYNQLTSSVRWEESVMNMINDGAGEFIEIGPGKVLQGLIKRINPDITLRGFDKAADLDNL
jgi:[acyl-carrier-protein] S-malonyltransferase